jgi:hypothetical protein
VVLAVALLALACATPAGAAQTVQAAAYQQMKQFMSQFDKDGFAKATDLGGLTTYRSTLAGLTIEIDPSSSAVAKYDPNTKTITFSKDPRKLKPSESAAFGETVWHEVTHAIEDAHGDIGLFDDADYAERNVDFMTHVARSALPILEMMERQAKAGASVAKLKLLWEKYLKAMAGAATLPSTLRYPPDLALIRSWFGFKADPAAVKLLYLSGKVLPGKQGVNLRKALALPAQSWDGRWETNTALGDMVLTQSGSAVTGYFANTLDPPDAFVITGTLGTDGRTFSGMVDQKDPRGYDWRFVVTMDSGWSKFTGSMWVIGQENLPFTLEGTRT